MHRSLRTRLGAIVGLSALLLPGVTAQTTVNITANLDNTLYEDLTGSLSNGIGTSIFVGQTASADIRRALVRFNVAAVVPAGAAIVSASLRFNVAQSTAAVPLDVDIHACTRSWGEGTSAALGGGGSGALATAGDATWLHRFWNTTPWSTPGGDFNPTPSATFSMPTFGLATVDATPGLVADVQSWLNTPANNLGWLLKAQTESPLITSTARRLNSRESATNKPTLTVSYLMPGQTGSWGTGCPSGPGTFTFAFLGPMIGGTTVQLAHSNGTPNDLGFNIFALELYQPGLPLMPSCNLYLPLSGNWILGNAFVFDASGSALSPWPVPTAYPGLFFMSQSLSLASNALGLNLSNAGVAQIQ